MNVKRYISILLIIRPKLFFFTRWKFNGIWKTYPNVLQYGRISFPASFLLHFLVTSPWSGAFPYSEPTFVSRQTCERRNNFALSTGNCNACESSFVVLNCRSFCNETRLDERGIIVSKEDVIENRNESIPYKRNESIPMKGAIAPNQMAQSEKAQLVK